MYPLGCGKLYPSQQGATLMGKAMPAMLFDKFMRSCGLMGTRMPRVPFLPHDRRDIMCFVFETDPVNRGYRYAGVFAGNTSEVMFDPDRRTDAAIAQYLINDVFASSF